MGLSYHFTFAAPLTTTSSELTCFLKNVEQDAKKMGFKPTLVLEAEFDTPEKREFARRLTTGLNLESEQLKGVVVLRDGQVWNHDPVSGACRVIPERGVLLVVTDERKCEVVFGFLKYPTALKDLNGMKVVPTGMDGRWYFRDFVDSPDVRFRTIVKRFAEAGYVEAERDEFAAIKGA